MPEMKVDPVLLCEMWNRGDLVAVIAEQFGVSRQAIWKWVRIMDLPRRKQ